MEKSDLIREQIQEMISGKLEPLEAMKVHSLLIDLQYQGQREGITMMHEQSQKTLNQVFKK